MKYIAIINADEKPVSCEFFGCNGNVRPYSLGTTTDIKALKQEPCEDAVSRQAVLNEFDKCYRPREAYFCVLRLEDAIKFLPPVQPIRPKGKWIKPDYKCDAKIWRKCSACNYNIEKFSKYVNYTGAHYFEKTINFCPICGADMRGEDNG